MQAKKLDPRVEGSPAVRRIAEIFRTPNVGIQVLQDGLRRSPRLGWGTVVRDPAAREG